MQKDNTYYKELMTRFLNNECTDEEVVEILDYIGKSDSNRLLLEQMQAFYKASLQEDDLPEAAGWSSRVRMELLKNINTRTAIPVYKRQFFRAAAVVFLLLSAGAFFYFSSRKTIHNDIASGRKSEIILPGSNKATLTLADGSLIDLNEAGNGDIAFQGDVKVIKTDGKINYNVANTGSNVIAYNTITTPRGGQYAIVLADGSKVWLNATSSLRFPTSFNGSSRKVELTGEGYFEIAQSKLPDGRKQPFFVSINTASGHGGIVEVLGTHFNIMAYDEEGAINTTLLEGAVKLNTGEKTVLLKPGQQAHVTKGVDQVEVLVDVDTDSVIAWKNGEFRFDNTDLKSIMRQIERWYDINIIYDKNIPEIGLSGKIKRKNNIEQLLEILEATHKIQFRIEGKNVFVAPYKKQ
ncbi:MAG: FecR family protein [Terrimonas sp.]|nr:FecR family protein [Terrimonas sp.]OJY81287.1 MAG: hypothetical protein BGP13_14875 [Sphingobacteriales bacterium 40-81]